MKFSPRLENLVKRVIPKKKEPIKSGYQFADFRVNPSGNIGVSETKSSSRKSEPPKVEKVIDTGENKTAESVAAAESKTKPLIHQAKEMLKAAVDNGEGQFKVLSGNDLEMEIAKRVDAKLTATPDLKRDAPEFDKEAKAIRDQVTSEN